MAMVYYPTWTCSGTGTSSVQWKVTTSATCNTSTLDCDWPATATVQTFITSASAKITARIEAQLFSGSNWTTVHLKPTSGWAWADCCCDDSPARPAPGERLREIILARQAPLYLPSHRKLLQPVTDERELRARSAFRRIVGEHNWRTYCAKGYVSVRAKSGRVYQIFAGRDVTRVYENGRLTERLCVQLAGGYADTDAILMRYVLVLSDEATFRRVANHTIARYEEPQVVRRAELPKTDLVTEWRRLRGAA